MNRSLHGSVAGDSSGIRPLTLDHVKLLQEIVLGLRGCQELQEEISILFVIDKEAQPLSRKHWSVNCCQLFYNGFRKLVTKAKSKNLHRRVQRF
jgi:hypothetical protein